MNEVKNSVVLISTKDITFHEALVNFITIRIKEKEIVHIDLLIIVIVKEIDYLLNVGKVIMINY